MIKAILMIYILCPFLVWSVMTEHKEIVGLCMCVAFACGMFSFYFISAFAKEICNKET